MIVFVVAGALTLAAVAVRLPRGWLVWAIPALAAFGLSIGREPSVVFLGLFVCATLILGFAVLRGSMRPACFALFAVSDLFLALALSAQQRATSLWTLPVAGEWAPRAAALLVVASILRLGAIRTDSSPGSALVGWWQGVALAWWAGPSAPWILVVGGLALWGSGGLSAKRYGVNYLVVTGGLIALVSAAGGTRTAIVVAALAGLAGLMGERMVSTFALALAPLSVATVFAVPFGAPAVFAAILLPAAALWAGPHLTPPLEPAASPTARLIAAGAAILGVFMLDASRIVWLMLATVAATGAVLLFIRSSPIIAIAAGPNLEAPPPNRRVMITAWILVGAALLVAARLALNGLSTRFL